MNLHDRYMAMATAAAAALVLASQPRVAAGEEIDELRSAVQTLQQRLDRMEKTQGATPAWVGNFTWKGDLRFRFESIDQQYAPDRNRLRIRARAGFVARVNDTVRSEFALATTEGNDPRASNQTLTGEASRKSISLDLAWVEWAPGKDWKLTAGKMRYPLIRPGQSTFIDADVNPEGIAVNWTHGEFSAAALYNVLEERAAARESVLVAGQFAWQPKLGPGTLQVGAGFHSFSGVEGFNPFHNNAANGNTTTSVALDCKGVATCLVNDYDILQLFGEWSQPVAGQPLSLYVDYAKNTAADNDLDTALSLGVSWRKARDPGTWEAGYSYQTIEKDAVYGQFADSDFGAGLTDSRGSVLRLAFAPARNWVVGASYYLNDTNVDVPATVPNVVDPVRKRDYRRLQFDLNFKY